MNTLFYYAAVVTRFIAIVGILLQTAIAADSQPPANVDPKDKIAVRRLFDAWKTPVRPRRLIGNIHYVGASGVSSFLITTPAGHVLLDTGFADTVPLIRTNVAQLGFKIGDIKFILSSHAHVDHTGGHALMKQLTGARIVASAADAHLLASGGADDFSPFPKEFLTYTPVKTDRVIQDNEIVSLGDVTLTAHLTPGHTKGATTWTMETTDEGRRLHVVFFSSTGLIEGTRLLKNPLYPNIATDYEATFKKLKTLPCEVFFGPHGGMFAMAEKFDKLERGVKPNPFIDPDGWRELLAAGEKVFRAQLARERSEGRQ